MKWIRFSRNEKTGLLILCLVLLINVGFHFYKNFQLRSRLTPISTRLFWLGEQIKTPETISTYPTQYSTKQDKKQQYKLFEFNPNNIQADSISLLGISRFAKSNLLKYRENGGQFKKKSDLKKIFGLTEAQFEKLYPYIDLPVKAAPLKDSDFAKTQKKHTKIESSNDVRKQLNIDINSATSEELSALKGIGPVLSERILKYRELLGGFINVIQVNEVYGLPDSTYNNIESQLQVKNQSIKKILINEVAFKELIKHPYADYELTRLIINYRKQHKYFRSKEDLENIYGLDQTKLIKLTPYLDFSVSTKKNEKDESNLPIDLKPDVNDTSLQSPQFHPQFQMNQGQLD